jgi:hypothetical protein
VTTSVFDAPRARRFIEQMFDAPSGGYRSVPNGPATLYGTCYGLLTRHYLGETVAVDARTADFIASQQDPVTGLFVGVELNGWAPADGATHGREHLLMHLTATALAVCQQFQIPVKHPLKFAHPFCEPAHVRRWLDQRDMSDAWYEGNNILFVGQFLVYLRDVEKHSGAAAGLEAWFDWLDEHVDPATGLWGTRDGSSLLNAMAGGYHQLLVYYHEQRPVRHARRLVDSVLSLQQRDGGFADKPGGGACEDVDAVDILVNMYKQHDYARGAIRDALRQTRKLIISQQGADGGFCYRPGEPQTHMGIAATTAPANVSCMFPTWFRVHTLALIHEVLEDGQRFGCPEPRFSTHLSMGWHRPWHRRPAPLKVRAAEATTATRRLTREKWLNLRWRLRGVLGGGRST